MNWIRRNWLRVIVNAVVGVLMFYCLMRSERAFVVLTAHAQKPEIADNSQPVVLFTPYMQELLGKYVESHCVAVLTEKHEVHHKLGPTAPTFDDRTEWDDHIPEQTLKLRCTGGEPGDSK
jgi:hypothetical protein